MDDAAETRVEPPRIGEPLDPLNDGFHAEYGRARDSAAREGPVLVLIGDELTLVRGDASAPPRTSTVARRVFHAVKSIAHVPTAVFVVLRRARGGDAQRRDEAEQALGRIATLVDAALGTLADDVPDPAAQRECREMLERSRDFVQQALRTQLAIDEATLETFAFALGPAMLSLIDFSTREQLAGLDASAREVFATLTAAERSALHVVVAGNHQARARSLGMQYFERVLLGETRDVEERVTYAEAVDTVAAAVELVGTQRLDRVMARAFFGDEMRMQRDLLGDAAARILDAAGLEQLP